MSDNTYVVVFAPRTYPLSVQAPSSREALVEALRLYTERYPDMEVPYLSMIGVEEFIEFTAEGDCLLWYRRGQRYYSQTEDQQKYPA